MVKFHTGIYAGKTDTFRVLVVQDFERVAVKETNNFANPGAPVDTGSLQYCAGVEGA